MRKSGRTLAHGLCAGLLLLTGVGHAQVLTADRAVEIALQKSPRVINAEASVLDARGGLYGAYSGVLPRVSADLTRSGSWTNHTSGTSAFGSQVFANESFDNEFYSTVPQLSGTWSPLNLSSLTGLSAARGSMKAAKLSKQAARNDVALDVRRQFYEVVSAVQLVRVNSDALKLSRDDERRVRALFEVGSVSKSDLLKAQVRTSQSELDSLTAQQTVLNQRVALAGLMGIRESEIGEVDTVLTVQEIRDYDESALVAEAEKTRPDLLAAEAEFNAAKLGLRSARLARLPYVTASGSAQFNTKRSQVFETDPVSGTGPRDRTSTSSEVDRSIGASIALSWDVFDGLATDSRIASARARYLRAQDVRDAARRNLASEVNQALTGYRRALEGDRAARRGVESAEENLKLTQQKYNVGSATILDLIDAQVQLQRARSQQVAALAAIRVAEAALERIRGRAQ